MNVNFVHGITVLYILFEIQTDILVFSNIDFQLFIFTLFTDLIELKLKWTEDNIYFSYRAL